MRRLTMAALLLCALTLTACGAEEDPGTGVASAGGTSSAAQDGGEELSRDEMTAKFAQFGGVGVANTMVISVLERRAEIGLHRSLGATRGQVRTQFLAESLLLSALGGTGGALLGTGVTAVYATYRSWPPVIPLWAVTGGAAATLVIGGLAGLYPAVRAARLSPTEALATP